MNSREIQRAIMAERYHRTLVAPNYTPIHWFECDVFELTPAGFFNEFEIKLSASDFKADATKKHGWRWVDGEYHQAATTKHQMLAAGNNQGPKRFWFVIPIGVAASVCVPDWAGLIIAHPRENCRTPFSVRLQVEKSAPQLHGEKADPKVKDHVLSIFYHRFQRLFIHNEFTTETPEIAE